MLPLDVSLAPTGTAPRNRLTEHVLVKDDKPWCVERTLVSVIKGDAAVPMSYVADLAFFRRATLGAVYSP